VDELIRAIRENCSPATWSRGVKLARSGAVRGVKEEPGEIELRVTGRKQLALEVILYPNEPDWSCECDGSCSRREDACDVVAAAAIAVKQAREQGQALPGEQGRAPAHIGYRLDGRTGTLTLLRTIVQGAKEVAVPGGAVGPEGRRRGCGVVAEEGARGGVGAGVGGGVRCGGSLPLGPGGRDDCLCGVGFGGCYACYWAGGAALLGWGFGV